jgi:hypothetical protein
MNVVSRDTAKERTVEDLFAGLQALGNLQTVSERSRVRFALLVRGVSKNVALHEILVRIKLKQRPLDNGLAIRPPKNAEFAPVITLEEDFHFAILEQPAQHDRAIIPESYIRARYERIEPRKAMH